MTKRIDLSELNINHFTVFDAEMYCQLSNINPDNIKELYLQNNNLTDISGIDIFKNLDVLFIGNNLITSINDLQNLNYLKALYIDNLDLTDEPKTVKILKTLPNLKILFCFNTFKIVDIRKELKKVKIYD